MLTKYSAHGGGISIAVSRDPLDHFRAFRNLCELAGRDDQTPLFFDMERKLR